LIAGIGLGAIVSGMKHISDDCFLVSARCLSEQATPEDLKAGCLFPALENIRAVSAKVRASRQYQLQYNYINTSVFVDWVFAGRSGCGRVCVEFWRCKWC
jgi:malic enzyme